MENSLNVKEWFHNKKANEKKKRVNSSHIFAILKETEKAYNVLVGDTKWTMTYWVPKSCTEIISEGRTLTGLTYEEAAAEWNSEMAMFR